MWTHSTIFTLTGNAAAKIVPFAHVNPTNPKQDAKFNRLNGDRSDCFAIFPYKAEQDALGDVGLIGVAVGALATKTISPLSFIC